MKDKLRDNAYFEEFKKFVLQMEQLPYTVSMQDLKPYLEGVCNLLRVAKIETDINANPNIPKNTAAGNRHIDITLSEDADEARVYKFSRINSEGNEIIIQAYAVSGSPEWDGQDLEYMRMFITTLYVFNSRARLTAIAIRSKYRDEDFHMYNMNYFMKEVGDMLQDGSAFGLGCCRFNIRAMSVINRQYGMDVGTAIMRKYVRGLESMITDHGFVARIGGDNFAAIFHADDMQKVKDYMSGALVETGQKGREKIRVSASAGLYVITKNCKRALDVMDRLMIAMEGARREKNCVYKIYDEAVKKKNEEKKWVESQFDAALEQEEFLVYYQPKVNIRENVLCGAEALCRWKHEGEIIPPMKFIPLLEQNGKICMLDYYMLEHVCRDIREWLDSGKQVVRVSVNMSRVHLENEEFVSDLYEIVDKYEIPHEYIEFELTETTTDVDFKKLGDIVQKLSAKGFSTSVDDFGIGYSSLNLIRDLPWNVLKIDKSFLPSDEENRQESKNIMFKHVIRMAKDLGLECIVEGAETISQIRLLRDSECEKVQGYFFDKPLTKDEFEKRLLNPQYEYKAS